jgi:putative peptide zinc metalloprotease protein
MMNGIIPSVYADVTDIWMSTRGARIAVSFAGPFSGLVLSAQSAILGWLVAPSWPASFFLCFSILVAVTSLINLYPFLFLEFDGYHILTDLLKQTALRERTPRFLRRELWEKLRARQKLTRDDLSLLCYSLLSIFSLAGLIAAFVALIACQVQS